VELWSAKPKIEEDEQMSREESARRPDMQFVRAERTEMAKGLKLNGLYTYVSDQLDVWASNTVTAWAKLGGAK
jgi:hypothetical protein